MKLKLITPLLLIVSTLFFVANADAENPPRFTCQDFAEESFSHPSGWASCSKENENGARSKCAKEAGKAGTEHAAKQIEKTCLEEYGLKPKGWFD